jgi:hypothetical protein
MPSVEVLSELIETERNYVDSLLICEEVDRTPLDRSIPSKNSLIDPPTPPSHLAILMRFMLPIESLYVLWMKWLLG